MGNVSVLQMTTVNAGMSLLDNIKSANKVGIPTNRFLNCVFQSVKPQMTTSFETSSWIRIRCCVKDAVKTSGQESACRLTAVSLSCALLTVTVS